LQRHEKPDLDTDDDVFLPVSCRTNLDQRCEAVDETATNELKGVVESNLSPADKMKELKKMAKKSI
jgi:hypothetical protein